MGTTKEPEDTAWEGPETSLLGRYEGDVARLITFAPAINHEVSIQVGDAQAIHVDALDLMRVVSHVVFGMVYEPSPTELPRFQAREGGGSRG